MDLKKIKELISIVEEANITHFSIQSEDNTIEIKKDCYNKIPTLHPTLQIN